MKDFKPLSVSSKQRCDVVVYTDEKHQKVILTVEVRSSRMLWTERKATYGATDLLRLLRFSQSSINEVTTFCFPNNDEPSCIIEIKVEWKNFMFETYLKRYKVISEGVERLTAVVLDQNRKFPMLPVLLSQPCQLMELNKEELKQIVGHEGDFVEGEFHQYPSMQSIIVSNKTEVFKVLYFCDHVHLVALQMLSKISTLQFLLHISFFCIPARSMVAYKYSRVPHNCMTPHEAKQCLKMLVSGLQHCLSELHKVAKICHNDIRLENVCFGNEFQPILIDLDRCTELCKDPYSLFGSSADSCMYDISELPQLQSGEKTDFFQVGWLVAWVMNEEDENYHDREWKTQPESIKNNKFIKKLVEEGFYDASLTSSLPGECSLESVLERRYTPSNRPWHKLLGNFWEI